MDRKTALIVGATGLVGGHVLRLLLENAGYGTVKALVRRTTGIKHPKLSEHLVNFDDPKSLAAIASADDVFCCLGTTIKKAKTREAFFRVDFTYPVLVAKTCEAAGAGQFLIVTALGANPRSSIFYNRVKGEVEEAIRDIGFKAAHIFRPSLLLGKRSEKRVMEGLGGAVFRVIAPLMRGPLDKYRPVEAADVARAMVTTALSGRKSSVYESHQIRQIARGC